MIEAITASSSAYDVSMIILVSGRAARISRHASTPEPSQRLEIVEDVVSAFYLHLEVADRPGVLAQVAQILGMQGASIKSVVQKGLGENARLVMVVHPILESRLRAAVALIGQLEFLRSPPRAIRVIEEEFV